MPAHAKHYVNMPKLGENLSGFGFANQLTELADSLTNRLTNEPGSKGHSQSHSSASGYSKSVLQALDKKVDSFIQALSGTLGINL